MGLEDYDPEDSPEDEYLSEDTEEITISYRNAEYKISVDAGEGSANISDLSGITRMLAAVGANEVEEHLDARAEVLVLVREFSHIEPQTDARLGE